MTVETTQISPTMPSDEALIAELTPDMLTKLKADSRLQAISLASACLVFAAFVLRPVAKQMDNWLSLPMTILAWALGIFALVTLLRGFYIGQPSALRNELRYRRQHGKWRWEH